MIVVGPGSHLYGSPLSFGLLGLFVARGSRMSRARLAIPSIGVMIHYAARGGQCVQDMNSHVSPQEIGVIAERQGFKGYRESDRSR